MENTVKKLIDQAAKWVGYLEKRSNARLDDFTANEAVTTIPVLPGITGSILAATIRGSLGALCSYPKCLCRHLVWIRPGCYYVAVCIITVRQERSSLKKQAVLAALRSRER